MGDAPPQPFPERQGLPQCLPGDGGGDRLPQRLAPAHQRLGIDPRRQHGVHKQLPVCGHEGMRPGEGAGQMRQQHVRRRVPEVLVGQGAQQRQRPRPLRRRAAVQERLDGAPVAPAGRDDPPHGVRLLAGGGGERAGGRFGHEGRDVAGPAGVVFLQPPGVFRLTGGGGGQGRRGGRRLQIEVRDERRGRVRERHREFAVEIGWSSRPTAASVLPGPDQHAPPAAHQGGPAVGSGGEGRQGIELRVVVKPEGHLRPGHRPAGGVHHPHPRLAQRGVAGGEVQHGAERRALQHRLRAGVGAVHAGVDEHRPAHRLAEPRQVQLRLRLAGAQVMPGAVHPRLHPGVVVVGVGPARRVTLAGGNPGGPERRDREHRLLAAAPVTGADGRERRAGARVGALVDHPLVAPVVDLEHRLPQGEPGDAVPELGVHVLAEGVEGLVVHAQRQDEVAEQRVGDLRPPGQLAAGLQAGADGGEVEVAVVVGQVGQGHVGVQEFHGLPLFARERAAEDAEQGVGAVPRQLPGFLKPPLDVGPAVRCGAGGRREARGDKQCEPPREEPASAAARMRPAPGATGCPIECRASCRHHTVVHACVLAVGLKRIVCGGPLTPQEDF